MHYTTAAEAVKLIRSNDSVYIQGSTSIPEVLVRAMTDRAAEPTRLRRNSYAVFCLKKKHNYEPHTKKRL